MKNKNTLNEISHLMNAYLYKALTSVGVSKILAEKVTLASARNSMQYIKLNESIKVLDQSVNNRIDKLDIKFNILYAIIGGLFIAVMAPMFLN